MEEFKMTYCQWCGKSFVMNSYNQRYCGTECARAADRQRQREYIKKKRKKQSDLARINEEARARGMSYGKYVAMLWDSERNRKERKEKE